jgi:hypothetical protein
VAVNIAAADWVSVEGGAQTRTAVGTARPCSVGHTSTQSHSHIRSRTRLPNSRTARVCAPCHTPGAAAPILARGVNCAVWLWVCVYSMKLSTEDELGPAYETGHVRLTSRSLGGERAAELVEA